MDNVEEIKQRLDVSEVLASYIQLKPAGRNFRALCPFHHEKTASFVVSDGKGIWHCFGCGEGGDIFEFVMKMEGLDFRQALELLANRAGVNLEPAQTSGVSVRKKQRLTDVLSQANRYFQAVLARTKPAQTYLAKRGFSTKTIQAFGFGYAPADGISMSKALRSRGITDAELSQAGLIRATKPARDLFRARLMIPLADSQGKIVGFTGRVLDDSLPKYLNTPQTLLFDKGRLLFGLFQAKEAIRKSDEAVIVEGHLDVVASHQAGINQVVASGGTALTIYQLKQLARLAKTIKLALDQDAAGVVATERAIALAQAGGAALYIVNLAGAKDPDELLRQKDGPKNWQAAIKQAAYVMDWLIDSLIKQYDLTAAQGKKQLTDRVMQTLSRLADPVEKDHYIQKLAKLVEVSPQVIRQKLAQKATPKSELPVRSAVYQAPAHKGEGAAVEDALLSLVVSFADTRTSLQDIDPSQFERPDYQALVDYMKKQLDAKLTDRLPKVLQDYANTVKILLLRGEEGYQTWASLDRRIEAFSLAARLQNIAIHKQLEQINQAIKQAETIGNLKLKTDLLRQFRDLARK